MRYLCSFVVCLALCGRLTVQQEASSAIPKLPCEPSWPRPFYYMNFDDRNTMWKCANGELRLVDTGCEPGMVFKFLPNQGCVKDEPDVDFTYEHLMAQ